MGRRIAIWTAVVLGAILVAIGAFLLWLNTDPGRRFVVGQINAIELDPIFNNGDYTKQPTKGIEAFALIWTAWLYSQ